MLGVRYWSIYYISEARNANKTVRGFVTATCAAREYLVWLYRHPPRILLLKIELKYTKLEKITINKLTIHYHHLGPDLVSHLDDLEPLAGDRLEHLGVDNLVDKLLPLLEGPPCGGAPEHEPSPSPTVATLDCTRITLLFCILRWFILHII